MRIYIIIFVVNVLWSLAACRFQLCIPAEGYLRPKAQVLSDILKCFGDMQAEEDNGECTTKRKKFYLDASADPGTALPGPSTKYFESMMFSALCT